MRFMKHLFLLLLFLSCSFTGFCQNSMLKGKEARAVSMGMELDGSQTIQVVGVGKNRADAIEQAQKNAVWIVIFNGVHEGKGSYTRPLLNQANAHEVHESFFNAFFKDGGEYRDYVSMKDSKRSSIKRVKTENGYECTVIVRVLRSELKDMLEKKFQLKLK